MDKERKYASCSSCCGPLSYASATARNSSSARHRRDPPRAQVIDEFAADLDIFSRARFFEYLSKECALRGAADWINDRVPKRSAYRPPPRDDGVYREF